MAETSTVNHEQPTRLPKWFIGTVVLICALPLVLHVAGVNLASDAPPVTSLPVNAVGDPGPQAV